MSDKPNWTVRIKSPDGIKSYAVRDSFQSLAFRLKKYLLKKREMDYTPKENDMAIVNIPVKVIFEKRDDIVVDVDDEGKPCEFKTGLVMQVVNEQGIVYNGEPALFLGNVMIEKD